MSDREDEPIPEPGATARGEKEKREARSARIVLIRHGEPDWTPNGGPSIDDPALTEFGRAQAEATADRLASENLDAIYVSPYKRSQQTAAALESATGLKALTVKGLAEVGIAVDGLSQGQVDDYFMESARRPLHEHWQGWPGAETFHDFHARVASAIADILSRHGGTSTRGHDFTVWDLPDDQPRIAIVAHGGTNAVALSHLMDIRPVPCECLRFESQLCAFSVLQAKALGPRGHVWSLQHFNEVDHLYRAGLR